jgi:hypothetical protein
VRLKEQKMIRARSIRGAASLLALLGAVLCGSVQAQQGEQAVMKRAAQLRQMPSESARSLASLPAQEPVTRLGERQGAWIQVQTGAGASGWVHMFDLGPGTGVSSSATAAPASGGNAVTGSLRGITSLLRGSPQPSTVATSTIGIRGLGAEDLARAQPNLNAVAQMEQLRQGEAGAREFAAEAALAPATVPALPTPSRRAPPGGGNANPGQMP